MWSPDDAFTEQNKLTFFIVFCDMIPSAPSESVIGNASPVNIKHNAPVNLLWLLKPAFLVITVFYSLTDNKCFHPIYQWISSVK